MATPTVTAIDIASGPSGTMVVITGSSFDDSVTKVEFGTYSAGDNYLVSSETEIVAYVPEGTGSSLAVKVTNADGTGTLSSAWTYDTYEGGPGGGGGSAPVVSDIVPDTSAYDDGRGGDVIEITGTGFTTAKFVYFDAVPVDFTINSDTSISTVSPPQGTVGSYVVEVDVENDYGRSADPGSANNFTYPSFDVPTITGLSPSSGIAGQYVYVSGTNFLTATAVYFGTTYGAVFNIVSDSAIECWAPYGPTGTVDVLVTNPAGTSADPGSANNFTYAGLVTGLTVTPMANAVRIAWNPVSSTLPVTYRVYTGTADPPTSLIATTSQTNLVYNTDHDTLRYYAVAWVDAWGNVSALCAAVSATALEAVADVIADGAIDAMSMFASGIDPVHVVNDLPDLSNSEIEEDYPDGALVFLTTDQKLYRKIPGGPNTNSATGKATWNDRSSAANDGTLTNFGWTESSGWDGTGSLGDIYNLTFDGGSGGAGTNDYVSTATAISPATARVFSVESWVKPNAQSGTVFLTGSGALTNYYQITVASSGRPLCGYRAASGTIYTCTGPVISDSAWHHVVATWSSTGPTMYFYVDGVLQESKTVDTGTVTIDKTRIGYNGYSTAPTGCYYGSIAAVRVYDATLSQTEVTAHFRMGPFGVGYRASDLKLDYSAQAATELPSWVPAITGQSIDAVISGDQIIGNSIKAGQIAVGAIGADEIAVQSLAARQVYIGNFTNLVTNPMSEWDVTGKLTTPSDTNPDIDYRGSSSTSGAYHTGSRGRYIQGAGVGTEASYRLTNRIAVRPGEAYYLFCWGHLYSQPGTESATLRMNIYTTAGGAIHDSRTVGSINTASWAEYTMVDTTPDPDTNYWIMPSDAVEMDVQFFTDNLGTTNYAYIDEILCHRALDGDLIVDGSIYTQHLTAALGIDSPTIDGGTITGTYVNVETELKVGTDTTAGTITLGGTSGGKIRTASSGKRIEIQSGTYCDRVLFYSNHASEAAAADIYVAASTNTADLTFRPPNFTDGCRPYILVTSAVDGQESLAKIRLIGGNVHAEVSGGYGGDLYFDGALVPPSYTSGVTNGTFIQDADDVDRKVKIYFSSGTNKRLYFMHGSTSNYGYLDLTELDGHVDAAVAFTGTW